MSFDTIEIDLLNAIHLDKTMCRQTSFYTDNISIGTSHESTDKKVFKNNQTPKLLTKKVQFVLKPKIHTMYAWSFAYKDARKDKWQQMARDRFRFKDRISKANEIISPILLNKWKRIMENKENHT